MIKQIANYRTDAITYQYSDSGCKEATRHLGGYQSSCLNCPFWDKKTYWNKETKPSFCVYDPGNGRRHLRAGMRNEQIKKMRIEGRNIPELASMFNISQLTVRRALGDYCKE